MKYYVTTDIHGYFTQLEQVLDEQGFFNDTKPHKLIVCGDLFDRGEEALKLQKFIMDLMDKDEVILIRGNHEDLVMDMLHSWNRESYFAMHNILNGTVDTVCQLLETNSKTLEKHPDEVGKKLLHSPYIQKIIPSMLDYYETEKYIFVHGWIPCTQIGSGGYLKQYFYMNDWRNAEGRAWDKARWINGMEAAHSNVIEQGKTIVCGHWHCSFGHSQYEGRGGEFDNNPDFTPYYADGIIALDGCTAVSGKVNCVILDDK